MKANRENGYSITNLLHAFSIDVVVGALAMGMFAVKWCNATLPMAWWFILGLAVWIIYTSDHLIDSTNKQEEATLFRHRLHYLKDYLLITTGLLIAVTLTLSVWFLPLKTIFYGMGLGLLVALYLLLITLANRKNSYFFKEFFIAIIYVAGIWLSPLAQRHTPIDFSTVSVLLLFILLTISEGIIVSLYELTQDKSDHFGSFTTRFGTQFTTKFVTILLMTATASSFILLFYSSKLHSFGFLIIIAMAVILLLLLKFPSFFAKGNSYHWIGEMTFWLPTILWFAAK